MRDKILILLASYNGEKYIEQQIESIQQQTHQQWRLWIRDDGSSDNTVLIIARMAEADSRIFLVTDTLGKLGPAGNFSALMNLATSDDETDFICFADQDDVWMQDKLRLQIEAMSRLNTQLPRMIYSDLELVDENLSVIAPSAMSYRNGKHVAVSPIKVLVLQNYVTGCTVMMDKALLEFATPVPQQAYMHDWWVALCAASLGSIGFIQQPLVRYRQHGRNVLGNVSYWQGFEPTRINRMHRWQKSDLLFLQSVLQVGLLHERLIARPDIEVINKESAQFISDYLATFVSSSVLVGMILFFRTGAHRIGLIRNLALAVRLPWILTFCKNNLLGLSQ